MAGWIAGAFLAALVAVIWLQHRARRNTYQPLASRQPHRASGTKIPLGMEATDLAHVARAARRNETLERGSTNWSRRLGGSFAGRSTDTDVAAWDDDETYAARYHAAFFKDTSKESPK